jgi:hypothetical protein
MRSALPKHLLIIAFLGCVVCLCAQAPTPASRIGESPSWMYFHEKGFASIKGFSREKVKSLESEIPGEFLLYRENNRTYLVLSKEILDQLYQFQLEIRAHEKANPSGASGWTSSPSERAAMAEWVRKLSELSKSFGRTLEKLARNAIQNGTAKSYEKP